MSDLGVCMQCVLRTYTTHEMVLEVELANAGLAILKSLEDLIDQSVSHYALSVSCRTCFLTRMPSATIC